MAAALADPSKFTLPVAFGAFYQIIELLHDFLERSTARGPAFDAAVAAVLLTLAVVCAVVFGGAGLVYIFVLYNDKAEAEPMAPAAMLRLFTQAVTLISRLLFIIGVPLMVFLVRAADGRVMRQLRQLYAAAEGMRQLSLSCATPDFEATATTN